MTLIDPIATESDSELSPATPFSFGRPWPERLAYVLEHDARDEPPDRPAGDGARLRRGCGRSDAGRPLALAQPPGPGVAPQYRITRSSTWAEDVNPWRRSDRLPLLEGGLLGELIYGDEPRIIDDLAVRSPTTRPSSTSTGSGR